MKQQKVCKNKNCQKPLPENYKYKYCEACRNKKAGKIKKIGMPAVGIAAAAVLGVAVKAGSKVIKSVLKI